MNDDPVLCTRQQDIRKQLNRNEAQRRRKNKGAKPKGHNWVMTMQAQCMIIGHEENPYAGTCFYCRAKML